MNHLHVRQGAIYNAKWHHYQRICCAISSSSSSSSPHQQWNCCGLKVDSVIIILLIFSTPGLAQKGKVKSRVLNAAKQVASDHQPADIYSSICLEK